MKASLAVILFVAFLLPVLSVRAQPTGSAGNTTGGPSGTVSNTSVQTFTLTSPLKDRFSTVGGAVQAGIEIFTYLVILFAVLALVWVGFRYIMARGNPAEMTKLSSWLGWIVVGVAVVIGARVMIEIIINTLDATGTVDQSVIQSANRALNGR